MNDQPAHESSADEDSRWPTTPILAYGTFGSELRQDADIISAAASLSRRWWPACLSGSAPPLGSGGILKIVIALAPGRPLFTSRGSFAGTFLLWMSLPAEYNSSQSLGPIYPVWR